ncbi:lefty1 [Pholidichthys leucotaenia]
MKSALTELLRVCLLCVPLFVLSKAFTHEDVKQALLQRLGLEEVPNIQKRDVESLRIPTHIRNKYASMLKTYQSRRRRSLPSLAGILRGIPGSADISGVYEYSDTTRQRILFNMEARIPDNSEVTMAELKLYQRPTHHKRSKVERKNHRSVSSARVSIYWLEVKPGGSNRTSLVDSRLVPVHDSGWKSFDVTQAVHYWSKTQKRTPLHLEVRIEGERPGNYAAEMARRVRFIAQQRNESALGKPELVLYTLDLQEYGSRGDCDGSQNDDICCREKYFINFRSLTWTQYWVIEPAGYQAYKCVGGCRQPKRNYSYGERRCMASESAPLPMMYLVKKGDYTEIEVAEFPSMIVEKCVCSMNSISIV